MKKKPIIIIASVLVLALCAFLFIRAKKVTKPQEKEVIAFLDKFNSDLKQGFTDTLLNYFDGRQNTRQLTKLLGALAGKTTLNGKDKGLFDVNLASDNSAIKMLNSELIDVTIPIEFKQGGFATGNTTLGLRIRKISDGDFKIIQIDARDFARDFLVYQNKVNTVNGVESAVVYSPETLEAFKTADKIKSRYDSVVWFAHINKSAFFYVIKGKWNSNDIAINAQMGLVGPDLKEVIPVQYDKIYNIGGTFSNLIEVEKSGLKGIYDLNGKVMVPVNYDEIYPINDEIHIAVLKKGADYFYLQKDFTIADKVDIKLNDFFAKIKGLGGNYDIMAKALSVVTEYNSHMEHGAIFVAPSYLVSLNMTRKQVDFVNPLRKYNYEDVSAAYKITFQNKQSAAQPGNWLEACFYSIADHFLGGRGDFYEQTNVVVMDKKRNVTYTTNIGKDYGEGEGDGAYTGACDINGITAVNDSLFEIKSGANFYIPLYDSTKVITGGLYYNYFLVKGNKLAELPNKRRFSFTKYVKMDESYLSGCYELEGIKKSSGITPEMLRYMKNEIYADYGYQFKDKRWQRVFENMGTDYDSGTDKIKPLNTNVDDSLTPIDKYNINFINQKLKVAKPQRIAAVK